MYYSRSGNTKKLGKEIARGVKEVNEKLSLTQRSWVKG